MLIWLRSDQAPFTVYEVELNTRIPPGLVVFTEVRELQFR